MESSHSFLNSKAAIDRMGDVDIYLEIVQYYALSLDASTAEIHAAFQSGNMPEATRLAHSLKGNCATVGAEALRETCAALEILCRAGDKKKAEALFEEMCPELVYLKQALLDIKL